MKGNPNDKGFETRAIHAGQPPEQGTGAVTVPIYQTSTFAQHAVGETYGGYEYARTGNPTRTALEACIASLEGGKHGFAFASGMAATTTLCYLFQPGDHVILGDDVYGGTYRLFARVLSRYGITFDLVDLTQPEKTEAAFRPQTKLVWLETPTNPLLKSIDIAQVADLAHAHSARLAVDNTFASPYLQRPLLLGADFVVHSATKYLGGHSDVVHGLVVLNDDALAERLAFHQNAVGAVPGPFDCFLVLRGIKTLGVRMRQHGENARRVADFLAEHPAVEQVFYPGLPGNAYHAIARRNFASGGSVASETDPHSRETALDRAGFGGMVSFLAKGGEAAARQIVSSTQIFTLAESLGGVESLIEHPGAMTHASLAGSPIEVPASLVRLSVGIENADDLLADLAQALE
ncbi:MAG TPA: cystathionine gamma-synthase [Chthonomonadaceae bacterium]|nr:cystathionine gamma-synthase [Chthonomonadaceae bacterium]